TLWSLPACGYFSGVFAKYFARAAPYGINPSNFESAEARRSLGAAGVRLAEIHPSRCEARRNSAAEYVSPLQLSSRLSRYQLPAAHRRRRPPGRVLPAGFDRAVDDRTL